MRRELVLEIEGAQLSGTLVVIEDEFDHAFGRTRLDDSYIADFEIFVWIEGLDVDVTDTMRSDYYDRFARYEKMLLEHGLKQIESEEGAA
jgi:hypothetical protein